MRMGKHCVNQFPMHPLLQWQKSRSFVYSLLGLMIMVDGRAMPKCSVAKWQSLVRLNAVIKGIAGEAIWLYSVQQR